MSGRDPIATMRRIWISCSKHMTLGVVHYDALSANHRSTAVIEAGLFDCRLGAALIVALCRAAGIPARMRSGYALYDVPYYHYWAEVWSGRTRLAAVRSDLLGSVSARSRCRVARHLSSASSMRG